MQCSEECPDYPGLFRLCYDRVDTAPGKTKTVYCCVCECFSTDITFGAVAVIGTSTWLSLK